MGAKGFPEEIDIEKLLLNIAPCLTFMHPNPGQTITWASYKFKPPWLRIHVNYQVHISRLAIV